MCNLIDDVERICLQRFVFDYLRPQRKNSWSIHGADIAAYRVRNRTGVPAEAITVRYEIVHAPGSWGVTLRAVWWSGGLLRPLGTHVAVERHHDLEDLHGEAGVRERFGQWLRALPL